MVTIALAGKGGSGKTTIAGLIIGYLLAEGKRPLLAIDADPNSNLDEVLGVKSERTVVSTVDEIMEKKEALPAGITKERLLEFHFQDALVESNGFDLLVMGRTEGAGCYCRANDLLRGFIEKLKGGYKYTVMDNEAGMEHLSRRTTRDVDFLLFIANPTAVSLKSAGRIYETSKKLKLNVKKEYLILNDTVPGAPHKVETPTPELLGKISYDEEVLKASTNGTSLLDLPQTSAAKKEIKKLMEKLGV